MIFQYGPFGDNAVRITHVVDDVRLIDRQIRIELDRKLRFGEIPLADGLQIGVNEKLL